MRLRHETIWQHARRILLVFRHDALSRRGGRSRARRRRSTSAEFSSAAARQRGRGTRHQTRDRCANAGFDYEALARQISGTRALRRRRNRRRSIKRISMGGRSARRHRELLLRHSALLRFDCAALQRRNHCRRYLRSDPRRIMDRAKRRNSALER